MKYLCVFVLVLSTVVKSICAKSSNILTTADCAVATGAMPILYFILTLLALLDLFSAWKGAYIVFWYYTANMTTVHF